MEIANRRVLASVIGIGLVLIGQVLAQESHTPMRGDPSEPEMIPIGPAEGVVTRDGADSPVLMEEGGALLGEEQPYVDDVFGDCPPAGCEICAGGSTCPPKWYVESDVRVLWRGAPDRQPTPITSELSLQTQTLQPRLFIHSMDYGIAPSLDVTIGRYLGTDMQGRDRFLEFEYWGLNQWNNRFATTGSRINYNPGGGTTVVGGDLFSAFPSGVPGFNRAEGHALEYESNLNSFELNLRLSPRSRFDRMMLYPNGRWRRECQPGVYFSYLTGVRYMRLAEEAEFNSAGRFVWVDADGNVTQQGTAVGLYHVLTRNDMLGFQLGGAMTYRECRWTADVHGKVGPYLNIASQRSTVIAHGVGIDPFANADIGENLGRDRNLCSVAGEVGFGGTYKFTPRLIGRASYDFMWLSQVALAPEQFNFVSFPTPIMNSRGTAFYHGLTMGLEYAW